MSVKPDPNTLREANRSRPPVDSWIDDAPITDRQLDVLRAELDNRFVAQFNKDVVRKLVHSVELARAERKQLCPEFGLRIDYVSTLREECPAGNNLADAQTERDRIAARPDVVSCTVIGWLAGEWHEIGDDRG